MIGRLVISLIFNMIGRLVVWSFGRLVVWSFGHVFHCRVPRLYTFGTRCIALHRVAFHYGIMGYLTPQ